MTLKSTKKLGAWPIGQRNDFRRFEGEFTSYFLYVYRKTSLISPSWVQNKLHNFPPPFSRKDSTIYLQREGGLKAGGGSN